MDFVKPAGGFGVAQTKIAPGRRAQGDGAASRDDRNLSLGWTYALIARQLSLARVFLVSASVFTTTARPD
jgi:hypothetical protein